jgi:hypothetical protein
MAFCSKTAERMRRDMPGMTLCQAPWSQSRTCTVSYTDFCGPLSTLQSIALSVTDMVWFGRPSVALLLHRTA